MYSRERKINCGRKKRKSCLLESTKTNRVLPEWEREKCWFNVFLFFPDSVSDKDLHLKYWTSGTDFQTPGTWLWGKDGTLGFSNWAGGQPVTHHCLAIDPLNQNFWVADDCEKSAKFICEIQ